jgi:hypothetical protein
MGWVKSSPLLSILFVRKLLENRHLRKRADAENQIKELRYEYGMEGCCSESIAATEHAFRWVMVAYNLMSLFKQWVMGGKSYPSLATVRFKCIALRIYIVHRGRAIILKIAAKDRKRDYIDELFVKQGSYKSVQANL